MLSFSHLARGSSLALAALAASPLVACANADVPDGSGVDSSESSASALSHTPRGACIFGDESCEVPGPLEFRNLLFAAARARNGVSVSDLPKLAYLPTPSMVTSTFSVPDAENPLAAYDAAYRTTLPSSLYDLGVRTPFVELTNPHDVFARSGPTTLVLVPGIFGEFIESAPFSRLLDAESTSLDTAWKRALAALPEARRHDTAYSLAALGTTSYPIDDLISVSSLDDANGQPLVNVILLKAPQGSLETVGTLRESALTYLHRLTTYFEVMGTPERFYFVGYSRGVNVALDLSTVATASRATYPWADHVAGVVSLGGPVYGTPLADGAFDPSKPLARIVARLDGLARDLEPCSASESPFARGAKVTRNVARWASALPAMGIDAAALPRHAELEWEGLTTGAPDLGATFGLLRKLLAQDVVRLDRPIANYCENVDRFKVLVRAFVDGGRSLTTASALAWWRDNVFPSHLKFFALTATMGDPTPAPGAAWPVATNTVAYNPTSLDYRFLRGSYYDLYAASGSALNDSQTIFSRTRIWPELARVLNPNQQLGPTYYLGMLGTHHWGVALPYAFPMADGSVNPFPRAALLDAIGMFLAAEEGVTR